VARTRPRQCLTLVACGLLAGACAREPSEADIWRATESMLTSAAVNPFTQPLVGFASGGKGIEIHELHKLGCRKAEAADGYRCDIELEVNAFGMPQRDRSSVRMVRSKDGWVAMRR